MNHCFFNVCGLVFRFSGPDSITIEFPSELFEVPAQAEDIVIYLQSVPSLRTPPGILCRKDKERSVWRDHSLITRCCLAQEFAPREMFSQAIYRLDSPGELQLRVRNSDWCWTSCTPHLWTEIMPNHILLHFQTLIFHASYINYNGKAILFAAPSQTGKSTQADLWQQYRGAEIVNGDKAAVRLNGGAAVAHGLPFCGTSKICVNRSLPLQAIVLLSQASENTVRRLPPGEAVAALFPNVFTDRSIPEEWDLTVRLLLDLVSLVPVYALACTPDIRAVETLEREIF